MAEPHEVTGAFVVEQLDDAVGRTVGQGDGDDRVIAGMTGDDRRLEFGWKVAQPCVHENRLVAKGERRRGGVAVVSAERRKVAQSVATEGVGEIERVEGGAGGGLHGFGAEGLEVEQRGDRVGDVGLGIEFVEPVDGGLGEDTEQFSFETVGEVVVAGRCAAVGLQPAVLQVPGALGHQNVIFGFAHEAESARCGCDKIAAFLGQQDFQQMLARRGIKNSRVVAVEPEDHGQHGETEVVVAAGIERPLGTDDAAGRKSLKECVGLRQTVPGEKAREQDTGNVVFSLSCPVGQRFRGPELQHFLA